MASPVRVAIVTSDGYEARGVVADPVGAATNYALVDAFTQFLERRLFTQNLVLLRRMVAEFFCHCETTVREFVAQGSMQISIGPFDADAADDLQHAERLLKQPHSFTRSGLSAAVFTFLVAKLRVARASLLVKFFDEFCEGQDHAIRAFVETKDGGFISIVPVVAPQCTRYVSPDGIPFESDDPLPMPAPPGVGLVATTPKTQRAEVGQNKMHPSGQKRKLAMKSQVAGRDDGHAIHGVEQDASREDRVEEENVSEFDFHQISARLRHPDAALKKLKTKLLHDFRAFEKHEPWTKVFTVELPLPFDEVAYPKLANDFREFWKRFGRAVWERNFWAPVGADKDASQHERRRLRQRTAVVNFRKLITACFEQFGPKFFYKLDRTPHAGWWYRGCCVDLLGLTTIIGYDKTIEYIRTQQHERLPDCGQALPLQTANIGVVLGQQNAVVSKSLWLLSDLPEIEKMKNAITQYAAERKQKKDTKRRAKHQTPQGDTVVAKKRPGRPRGSFGWKKRKEMTDANAAE